MDIQTLIKEYESQEDKKHKELFETDQDKYYLTGAKRAKRSKKMPYGSDLVIYTDSFVEFLASKIKG